LCTLPSNDGYQPNSGELTVLRSNGIPSYDGYSLHSTRGTEFAVLRLDGNLGPAVPFHYYSMYMYSCQTNDNKSMQRELRGGISYPW